MLIGHQLPFARQPLQRFLFEDAIVAVEIIEHAAIKHEKTGAGAAGNFRFLLKLRYTAA